MAPKLARKGAATPGSTPKVGPPEVEILGTTYPNLVTVRDTGKRYVEFRVQCEVLVRDADDAKQLEADLKRPRTPESLARAEKLVLKLAHPEATQTFRDIIKLAFGDQPETRKQGR